MTGSNVAHSALIALVAIVTAVAAPAADRVTGRAFTTRSEVIAPHAMACTSQPLATQIALDVLKAGGSAVDGWFELHAKFGRLPMSDLLVEMGHVIQADVGSFGGYQAIMYDAAQGVYYGASESRKDGQAAGY